jgi:hypothetical protein
MSKKVIVTANENFEDKAAGLTRTGGSRFVMSEEDAKKAGKSVTIVGPFGEPAEEKTREKKGDTSAAEKNKAAGPNDSKK